MAKTATLSSGLVAKKGTAAPTTISIPEANSLTLQTDVVKKTEKDYYKALTVKLDKERFHQLKQLGLKLDKSSQDIFVEALDAYLSQKT